MPNRRRTRWWFSPDNRSRAEINERIHAELQRSRLVSSEEHRIRTLVPRQNLTGADRTWVERYEVGDVLCYSRTSKETGIEKGEYAQVKSIDAPNNRLTVERQDGKDQTYDPRRQQGVSVFREEMRSFSVGDRIQFTAPANELKVANRELGTVKRIDEDGRLRLKMDGGRTVEPARRKRRSLRPRTRLRKSPTAFCSFLSPPIFLRYVRSEQYPGRTTKVNKVNPDRWRSKGWG
jgi:hypothetical protein